MEELGADCLPLSSPAEWQISSSIEENLPVNRFFQHKTKGEGFFLAILRKAEGEINTLRVKTKNNKTKKKESTPDEFRKWINQPDKFIFNDHNGITEAFPLIHKEDYSLLTEKLKIVSAGIKLGESKGKDLIPHPALALSSILDKSQFKQTEVTWEEAIRFLRKETINLDNNTEKGYHLITYQNIPLGFAKHIGNRTNNLYPSEWRIRSSYTPDEIKTLTRLT